MEKPNAIALMERSAEEIGNLVKIFLTNRRK